MAGIVGATAAGDLPITLQAGICGEIAGPCRIADNINDRIACIVAGRTGCLLDECHYIISGHTNAAMRLISISRDRRVRSGMVKPVDIPGSNRGTVGKGDNVTAAGSRRRQRPSWTAIGQAYQVVGVHITVAGRDGTVGWVVDLKILVVGSIRFTIIAEEEIVHRRSCRRHIKMRGADHRGIAAEVLSDKV